jgi:hypothetical protein
MSDVPGPKNCYCIRVGVESLIRAQITRLVGKVSPFPYPLVSPAAKTKKTGRSKDFRPGHAKKVQWLTYSSIHPSQQGTPGRRGKEKVCVAFSRDVTVNGLFAGSPLACHWCLPCAVYIHDTHGDAVRVDAEQLEREKGRTLLPVSLSKCLISS